MSKEQEHYDNLDDWLDAIEDSLEDWEKDPDLPTFETPEFLSEIIQEQYDGIEPKQMFEKFSVRAWRIA